MAAIPTHKATQRTRCGLFLKEVTPEVEKEAVRYAHQDDYYAFGLIGEGSCSLSVDFEEYSLSEGEVMCIQPGQVHRVVEAVGLKASLLFADGVFVGPAQKQTIAEYALCPAPLRPDEVQLAELKQVFGAIARRMDGPENAEPGRVVQSLAAAAIGMIAEVMCSTICRLPKNKRHVEITLAFRELLAAELPAHRMPAHYAELLHLSPVYLNEAVKNITGLSVGKYIQNELILRAKRMLVHTSQRIAEIARSLGFEDYAYFSRLFTKSAGMNPTTYRRKYLG